MQDKKLKLNILVALVIGSVIGGGIFNLPSDISRGSSTGAVIIAWIISTTGILSVTLSFYYINKKRPDIEGGLFNYARNGFGNFVGSLIGFGHWSSAWLGNISYLLMIFATLGYFFPIFEEGANLPSIIGASCLLWIFTFIILRGVTQAAFLNAIITITKFLPIGIFILFVFLAFDKGVFFTNFWGQENFSWSHVFAQVKNTMMVTLWVFIGVEGAITLSERAEKKSDVGIAATIGILFVSLIYFCVSLFPLGILSAPELGNVPTPSMSYLLKSLIGPIGGSIINFGILISLMGALLSWGMLSAEILFVGSKDEHIYPKIFSKVNKHGSPVGSLIITSLCIQFFLITVLFSKASYQVVFSMAAAASITPYLFTALFQLKLCFQMKDEATKKIHKRELIIGIISLIYTTWLCVAAGIELLLSVLGIYVIAIFVYFYTLYEQKKLKN